VRIGTSSGLHDAVRVIHVCVDVADAVEPALVGERHAEEVKA
jgi:hypothetical protein